MKKLVLLFISITLLLTACKKSNDYVFNQTPDERINASLAKYQTLLSGAENGWKAFIQVANQNKSIYSFYFKFTNDNRVKMVSDFDTLSAINFKESSFRLREEQQPMLIFDTYSYVHVLADPNEAAVITANVNGGPVGQGLLSDFEFIFDQDSIKNDTIKMVGKVNGAKLTLVKATKAEDDIFTTGKWDLTSKYIDNILTYYRRLKIGGIDYDLKLDTRSHQIVFNWLDAAGNVQKQSVQYYNSPQGVITFVTPFQNGSQTISSLSLISFDAVNKIANIANGTTTGTISETILPLKIDLDAPTRWLQYAINQGGYWANDNGFHVNGVDDGFQIKRLPSFSGLIYLPKEYFGIAYDRFYTFVDGTYYYNTITFLPDATTGIAKFKLKGSSNPPPPTSGPIRLTRNQLIITQGYYFVQIDDTHYDMVSAKDGKAWMQWYF